MGNLLKALIANWRTIAITALLATSLGFGGGVWFMHKLDLAAHAKELESVEAARLALQKSADDAAAKWETDRAALEAANHKLQGRLANETTKIVYRNCIVPDDGVQLYNEAITGIAASKSDGSVPSAR